MHKKNITFTSKTVIYLLFSCFPVLANAQFFLHNQLGKSANFEQSNIASPKAYCYESIAEVQEQKGEWHFKLKDPILTNITSFNQDGQYKDIFFFMSNDQLLASSEFYYNTTGRLDSITEESAYGHHRLQMLYDYNSKSNNISSVELHVNENMIMNHVWEKDSNGNSQETIYRDGKKTQQLIRQEQQIHTIFYYDKTENLEIKETITYNDQKMPLQLTGYKKDGSLRSRHNFTYQLNKYGDWIKRLEHHEETGKYRLTQRQIIYQEEVAALENKDINLGLWKSPLSPISLMLEKDDQFTLLDMEQDDIILGTWYDNGWGQLKLKVGRNNNASIKNKWRHGDELTAEIENGRLKLYHPRNQYFELLHEDLVAVPPSFHEFIAYKRWDNERWEKPGYRNPAAIPESLRTAYESVYAVSPGLFSVYQEDGTSGIANQEGQLIIPPIYEQVGYFQNNYYGAKLGGKTGLLDSIGQIVLPFEYDRIWPEFQFGFEIFGTRKNGKRYYYDVKAQDFLPFEKDDILGSNDDRLVVRRNGFWLLTDWDFNPITPDNLYRRIKILAPDRYLATGPQQLSIIDKNGENIASLADFWAVETAIYGYLVGRTRDDLHALLDFNGKQITETIYKKITFCKDEKYQQDLCSALKERRLLAHYKKPNGEEGYLDGFGREVKK